MDLPIKFLKFWYPDALAIFIRSWHNTLSFLEEDLAVNLMLRLLLVPLFHDSTIVGRVLSLCFRLSRILTGLLAYFAASMLIILLALFWFLAPILLFIPVLTLPAILTILFGVALFVDRVVLFPPQTLWHIKSVSEIMKTTRLKSASLTWDKLIADFEVQSLLQSLELNSGNFSSMNVPLTGAVNEKIYSLAKSTQAKYLTAAYFFVAMLETLPNIDNELLKINLEVADFEKALNFLEFKRKKWRRVFVWDEEFITTHLKGVNRGWLSAPTPNLDSISSDLTRKAAEEGVPDFIGRTAVLSEVITILSQPRDRNVLLIGPAGAGKSTLVNFLAKKIITGDAPESLATKRIVSIDLPKLLSGGHGEGDLAQIIKNAFEEIKQIQDAIIYVDEIHNLGIGDAGSSFNLYSLIEPYLESESFQFIASTEEDNYVKILEKNSSLARLFHKVEVPPASINETIQILMDRSVDLARWEKVTVTLLAIKEIALLSSKLLHDRVLPDSALSILNEAEAAAHDGQINLGVVKEIFSKRVNVPVMEVDSTQKELLLDLEDVIHQKFIDQTQAVKVVANTLRRSATALREQNRPIGSFLFVGPTGVGKTELAKTLSEVYFKTKGAFVRFDMSEYQTEQSVDRLLGTASQPGELTDVIRNKPYALVLLDEFEKANPQILNLFLQVLDDGRLTDASGHTVDFTNTIIIATSNAASLTIAQELEKGIDLSEIEKQVKEELLKVMKPELVNRFDEVVIFKPLAQADLEQIVKIKLDQLAKMLKDQGYLIEFEPDLISALAKKGFDPVLGARPLRRLIQDSLEAKLSRLILEGKLTKGETFIADASHF